MKKENSREPEEDNVFIHWMMYIALNIKNATKAKVSKSFLERIASQALDILKVRKNVELGLFLVGKDKMKALNSQYRGQDRVTDVLAFSQIESKKHFVIPRIPVLSLGDIIICYPQAKKQALRFGHSVSCEIAVLFVHGLLHLLGIDHETGQRQAKKMMELENKIIKELNL